MSATIKTSPSKSTAIATPRLKKPAPASAKATKAVPGDSVALSRESKQGSKASKVDFSNWEQPTSGTSFRDRIKGHRKSDNLNDLSSGVMGKIKGAANMLFGSSPDEGWRDKKPLEGPLGDSARNLAKFDTPEGRAAIHQDAVDSRNEYIKEHDLICDTQGRCFDRLRPVGSAPLGKSLAE